MTTSHGRSADVPGWLSRGAAQYALAVVLVAVATVLRLPFEWVLMGQAPYGLYFPAILVVAWFCGVGPTIVAALLSLIVALYVFVQPSMSFEIRDPGHLASVGIFVVTSGSLVWFARAAGRTQRLAQQGFHAQARLAAIVQSSHDAIVGKDLDGTIRSWNAAAERMFGYLTAEIIGRPVTVLIPPARRQEEHDILTRVVAGQSVGAFETVRMRKDGTAVDVLLTVSPIRDEAGIIVGAAKIARDITEKKRAERALFQQREWFRITLASIGDAVITTDRTGCVTFMNAVAEQLTGYDASEAQSRPLTEVFRIVNETSREIVENPCEKVLRTGVVVGLANHTVLIARDGTEHPIEDSAAPISEGDGEILGVVLVFHDVTQRRRAEEKLAEQREWLQTTLESIGDAVIATDLTGAVSFMNPVAERLTGWTSQEARGRTCSEVFRIVHETTRQDVESPVTRVLRDGVVVALANHTSLLARDGREVPIEDSAAPIRDRDGRVIGVVLVFHDVSERHRADRDRQAAVRDRERLLQSERAARADAERANRLKDEFVATLSHELRTPLNAILGWIEILRRKRDGATFERGMDVIDRNTRLQAQLISDLLDVSRIVAGKLRLELHEVRLSAVVDAALETIQPTASSKEIVIDRAIDQAVGPVAGDPARLQQVVLNLLSNAIKFTPPGGRVTVQVAERESHAELSVRDTGAGIAPEFLPYLFDRFRQADSSTTRRHGGLGLGLTIVKQLVDLHGGTVSASSEGSGRGACFVVRFPIGAEPRTADGDVAAARPPTPLPPALGSSLVGLKLLLVEDDADTRELVERLLREAGCRVVAVASATAAYESLTSERPDVLVSDIGLPGEDGYSLIQRIRKLDRNDGGSVPAIALTAFARPEDRKQALLAGFQAHVAKPVDPAELITVIGSFATMIQG